MQRRNSIIVVTEVIDIRQLTLTGSETALPNLPTGDLGRNLSQITIRSRDTAWEWRPSSSNSAWFWMAAGDILVFPIREGTADQFQFRRAATAAGTCDMRIIYEC